MKDFDVDKLYPKIQVLVKPQSFFEYFNRIHGGNSNMIANEDKAEIYVTKEVMEQLIDGLSSVDSLR